ncbi:hypothetical protein BC833DRAFT_575234 [Globomyces pollinis-pini]|nr:hypothetical protein BC833DRAFT_575234 [Globomyces pollinis-pini]
MIGPINDLLSTPLERATANICLENIQSKAARTVSNQTQSCTLKTNTSLLTLSELNGSTTNLNTIRPTFSGRLSNIFHWKLKSGLSQSNLANECCNSLYEENVKLRNYNRQLLEECEILSERLFEEANQMVHLEKRRVAQLIKENSQLKQKLKLLEER